MVLQRTMRLIWSQDKLKAAIPLSSQPSMLSRITALITSEQWISRTSNNSNIRVHKSPQKYLHWHKIIWAWTNIIISSKSRRPIEDSHRPSKTKASLRHSSCIMSLGSPRMSRWSRRIRTTRWTHSIRSSKWCCRMRASPHKRVRRPVRDTTRNISWWLSKDSWYLLKKLVKYSKLQRTVYLQRFSMVQLPPITHWLPKTTT